MNMIKVIAAADNSIIHCNYYEHKFNQHTSYNIMYLYTIAGEM